MIDIAPEKEENKSKIIFILLLMIAGLIGVIVGGDLVTYSASSIASKMGISDVLIGLTVVSICTSLPELVTTIVAAMKKENDIAIGNVVGSNIFNILFVLGITSIINPLYIDPIVLVDIIFTLIISVLIYLLFVFKKQINRTTAILMISLYLIYLIYIIIR